MPGLIDSKLANLRYTTGAFIKGNPRTIILNRSVREETPSGGANFTTVNLPPQQFRFINQDIGTGITTGMDDGIARRFTYVMVGRHDADIDINDSWEEGEQQYRVDGLVPDNGWERRAYVTCFAKKPDKG